MNVMMTSIPHAPNADDRRHRSTTVCRFTPIAMVLCAIVTLVVAGPASAQTAVRGGTVYTMNGEPITDGVVLVRDGRIEAVGPEADIAIPDGYQVLEAAVVTPGLIDARGTVGLSGIYNVDHDQDQIERSSPIQPELRALDAYNTHEQLVAWVRSFGITTVHTGHAPGELVSGQTMIVKTVGNTVDDAVIVETAAIAATMGPMAQRSDSPGTRGKMMAMLRQELIDAREYRAKRTRPDDADDDAAESDDDERGSGGRNLRMEALVQVLDRELPLLITANRAQDIATALRLAVEFDIRIWLDGAAESYLLIDEIRAAGVPVIIHPTMMRARGDYENLSFETAARLADADIPLAMQSSYEGYVPKTRVVLFEAGVAAANGLGFERALASITRDAANILGIGNRVGWIEPGKDADLALFSGDPFEYTTHCIGVLINGEVVSEIAR